MKKILFIISISLVLASCIMPNNKAIEFNDEVVEHYFKVARMEDNFKILFETAFYDKSYSDVQKAFDEFIPLIDAEIQAIEAIEVPAGGKDFFSSVLVYAKTVKVSMEVGNEMSEMSGITDPFAPIHKKVSYDKYRVKVTDIVRRVEKEQSEFAKRNRIEPQVMYVPKKQRK